MRQHILNKLQLCRVGDRPPGGKVGDTRGAPVGGRQVNRSADQLAHGAGVAVYKVHLGRQQGAQFLLKQIKMGASQHKGGVIFQVEFGQLLA